MMDPALPIATALDAAEKRSRIVAFLCSSIGAHSILRTPAFLLRSPAFLNVPEFVGFLHSGQVGVELVNSVREPLPTLFVGDWLSAALDEAELWLIAVRHTAPRFEGAERGRNWAGK